ncbi:hypothetical protein CONPUDRAFT_152676 [Coniophora puteana RWD-64-598 SS2]|uniref:F-box domain-containing protein n=1 Tax=Coniophora puteana (strain RWD-64-598) TaxID=741705 RepID=A0A5M3MRJ2_CONPW|nr:uncharacterized protein CONPUDRAFT_152676 [Coniophora puteana RWD-64-598 SS2]EIW81772.1 hypothetical protein CONPUDRAFT_152676 [Coniophora puteana RWD-64-598 SS2]
MHRVLNIAEILQNIFSCLNDGYTAQTGLKGNPTLYSLARTCRVFKDPALDALWEHIVTLDPVVKCLGKDAWQLVSSHVPESVLHDESSLYKASATLTRPLLLKDWAIIRKYTPRVRKLSQAPMVPFCPGVLEAILASGISGYFPHDMKLPLFPNIKSLDWSQVLPKDLHCWFVLYSPLVEDVKIGVVETVDAYQLLGDPKAFLRGIAILFPRLKSALIFNYWRFPGCTENFSQAVSGWKYLRSLHCEELTADAIAHLASLPTLTSLTFALTHRTGVDTARSRVAGQPFANLTSVSVVLNDLDLFAQFVSLMSLSPTEVELFMPANNTCSSRIEDVIRALAKHGTRRHLEKLRIVQTDYDGLPRLGTFTPRAQLLTIDSFRPLFKFKHLHTLHIDGFCAVQLTDTTLIELALAFPHLADFHLNANYGWQWPGDEKPPCTFYALYALLHLCPRLHTLGLELNAENLAGTAPSADVPEAYRRFPVPPPPNTAITHLALGESMAEDARAVAELLHAVMPNLESICVWDPESTTPDDDMMHLAICRWQTGIWRAVGENLNVLRRGGFRGSGSGETEAPESDGEFEEDEDDDIGDENEVSDE